MPEVPVQELLSIIGTKEVQIHLLKTEVIGLNTRIKELEIMLKDPKKEKEHG